VQTVNVGFAGVPTSQFTGPVPFAHVSGDSTAGSFVGGSVIGFNKSNFLDLQVNVTSQLDTSNAADDVFSVGLDVAGLNDAGSLAASIASGAQSLLSSQIGTWRQRMGVVTRKPEGTVGLSPWIRVFSDKGSIDPTHTAQNFGSGGNFSYDQSNSGREFGANLNPFGGFNVGLLFAKSEGTQRLLGTGQGTDKFSETAFGLYTTWIADNGFYVDASYRWMSFDADLTAAGGPQATEGAGGAFNVETGITAWNLGGVDVTPQFQYTRSAIGDIRALQGDQATFVANGGTSSRGRLGVAFSKTINSGAWTLTPYGSINALREFDGETTYRVADTFTGSTSTQGTSAMVELGLGARIKGVSITGGANWTDGGALSSFTGGQLVLRYDW
jgi:outer membrane autotransporter protein